MNLFFSCGFFGDVTSNIDRRHITSHSSSTIVTTPLLYSNTVQLLPFSFSHQNQLCSVYFSGVLQNSNMIPVASDVGPYIRYPFALWCLLSPTHGDPGWLLKRKSTKVKERVWCSEGEMANHHDDVSPDKYTTKRRTRKHQRLLLLP